MMKIMSSAICRFLWIVIMALWINVDLALWNGAIVVK